MSAGPIAPGAFILLLSRPVIVSSIFLIISNGFCKVWVFWQYVYLYLLCFVFFVLCFFILFRVSIFVLICFVCTNVRTTATK